MIRGLSSKYGNRFRCVGTGIGTSRPPGPAGSAFQWRVGMVSTMTKQRFESTTVEAPITAPTPVDAGSLALVASTNGDAGDGRTNKQQQKQKQRRPQVVGPKYARNQFFRNSFRGKTASIGDEVGRKMGSPYTPTMRDYPSKGPSLESRKRARSGARVQVGFDTIWKSMGSRVENFSETFNLLKKMTVRQGDDNSKMAAMKIVLPQEWELDEGEVGGGKVEFVDSATGLAAKLRVSADRQNPSAVILRGKSSVLAKAADELVAACPAVEVFRLGEVAAFGYEVKRLWPVIEGATEGGSSVPLDGGDKIWVHREQQQQPYWIEEAYEKTARPGAGEAWTAEGLERYVTALVFGRLRPHLAVPLYREGEDTDGVRVSLMMRALQEPGARLVMTPHTLRMAMGFMAHRGGHRAAADRLLKLAEGWGMPLDTDLFNTMLEGYAARADVGFFHKFLRKMQTRYFHPNTRTWLLFLGLVQREAERRQVIVAMFDLGFFQDPATRRGVARVMASHDAYEAFRAGKKLDVFAAEQTARYGSDWFTTGALNCILTEFFRFHGPEHRRFNDYRRLIERRCEDGQKAVDVSTANLVVEHCIPRLNWGAALWVLRKMEPALPTSSASSSSSEAIIQQQQQQQPDAQTYDLLIQLAIESRSPSALGVVFFYAVMNRMLRTQARARMRDVLVRRVRDSMHGWEACAFWREHAPRIFAARMGKHIRLVMGGVGEDQVVAAVEHAILRECDGYRPVKSLAYSLDVALRTMDGPFHQQLKVKENQGNRGNRGNNNIENNAEEQEDEEDGKQEKEKEDRQEAKVEDKQKEDLENIQEEDLEEIEVTHMAIRMRNKAGMKKTVHLDACFVPETMVRHRRRGRGAKDSAHGCSEAS